jgi:elongation factor G
LALARVLGGEIAEGADLKGRDGTVRLGALFAVQGEKTTKISKAGNGDIAAIGKADELKAGQWLSKGTLPPDIEVELAARNARVAVHPADRKDDVRLASALAKLAEEDSALHHRT